MARRACRGAEARRLGSCRRRRRGRHGHRAGRAASATGAIRAVPSPGTGQVDARNAAISRPGRRPLHRRARALWRPLRAARDLLARRRRLVGGSGAPLVPAGRASGQIASPTAGGWIVFDDGTPRARSTSTPAPGRCSKTNTVLTEQHRLPARPAPAPGDAATASSAATATGTSCSACARPASCRNGFQGRASATRSTRATSRPPSTRRSGSRTSSASRPSTRWTSQIANHLRIHAPAELAGEALHGALVDRLARTGSARGRRRPCPRRSRAGIPAACRRGST